MVFLCCLIKSPLKEEGLNHRWELWLNGLLFVISKQEVYKRVELKRDALGMKPGGFFVGAVNGKTYASEALANWSRAD